MICSVHLVSLKVLFQVKEKPQRRQINVLCCYILKLDCCKFLLKIRNCINKHEEFTLKWKVIETKFQNCDCFASFPEE